MPDIDPNITLDLPLDETGWDYLLHYAAGYFPMAEPHHQDDIFWHNPAERAVLPIQDLHISKSLRRAVLRRPYSIRINTAFAAVMQACAANRESTWLSPPIQAAFGGLHRAGLAHSVECWTEQGDLVGGIYGLALGSAFCGESMFSKESGASKIALVHLCARLAAGGFTLFDAQIYNDHTAQFGAYNIPQALYMDQLQHALFKKGDFLLCGAQQSPSEEERVRDFLYL